MSDFHEKSYTVQKAHIGELLNKNGEEILRYFRNKDTFESQIHRKNLEVLHPFLQSSKKWLTIGDYNGIEANYLIEHNQQVVASDLSDDILAEVSKNNYIGEFKAINVEHIDYQSSSFDYTFCKEAYHHFPRAYIGLYEMIRVADKATILVEPLDILSKMPLLLFLKNKLDRINPDLINRIWKNRYSFEQVGNYVFKISEREVEKAAMGIGLPCIAFKSYNTFFTHKKLPGANESPVNKKLWNKVTRRLGILNLLCYFGIIPYNTLCSIIFKQMPDEQMIKDLKKNNFKVLILPKNPYLK